MKLRRLLLVLLVLIAGLPVVAQENTLWKDGFTAGVGYGFNVRDIKTLDYKGVALSGAIVSFSIPVCLLCRKCRSTGRNMSMKMLLPAVVLLRIALTVSA